MSHSIDWLPVCNVYRTPENRGQSQQLGLKIEKKEEMSRGRSSVLPVNFSDLLTAVCLVKTFLRQKALLK